MDDKIRRKNLKFQIKNTKLLTGFGNNFQQPLRTNFDALELEFENKSLRQMLNLLEGKNKVLEEHCNLLKEKNHYFEIKLRDLQLESKFNPIDNDNDKVDVQKESKNDDNNSDENNTSFKDKLSGMIFGVVLPKLGGIFGKIREKGKEFRDFIKEQDGNENFDHKCPMQKVDFQRKIEAVKVNLFRVVVVLGSLMVLSGIGYAGYKIWKTRYRHPSYLIPSEDDDEDSAEEVFRAPGTSRNNQTILKTNSTDSFGSPGISTDFTSILDRASNK